MQELRLREGKRCHLDICQLNMFRHVPTPRFAEPQTRSLVSKHTSRNSLSTIAHTDAKTHLYRSKCRDTNEAILMIPFGLQSLLEL